MNKLGLTIRCSVQVIKIDTKKHTAVVKVHKFKQAGRSASTYYVELYMVRLYGNKIAYFDTKGCIVDSNNKRINKYNEAYQKLEEYRKKNDCYYTEHYYFKDEEIVKAE